MVGTEEQIAFVLNANVVIDYVDADRSVIALVAKYLGVTCLPRPLLREVEQIDEDQCSQLGLRLPEPTFAQLAEASRERRALSFEDRLCLIVARDHGATCVTNDKRLRSACSEHDVPVLWGLQLMHELASADHLTKDSALQVALTIQSNNPLHISTSVMAKFTRKLGRAR